MNIQTVKRWLARGSIAAALVIATLILFRNHIALRSVELAIEGSTGFGADVGGISLSAVPGRVDARNIRLLNPKRYKDRTFVEMPSLSVAYRPGSLLSDRLHIDELAVDISRLTVVKDAAGKSNLAELAAKLDSGGGKKQQYLVDRLRVHVGRVMIKDYSGGGLRERSIPLNLDASYSHITESTDVTRLVLLTVVNHAPLAAVGIDAGALRKNLGDVAATADETLKNTTESLQQAGKSLIGTLRKIIPHQGD